MTPYGQAKTIRLLLAAGARVYEPDPGSEAALDVAHDDESRRILRQASENTGEKPDADEAPRPPAPVPLAPQR